MNKFSKSTTLFYLILFLFKLNAFGQTTILNPEDKIYSSPNPKLDAGFTEDDLWKITFADAFAFDVDLTGGINATGDYSSYRWNGANWQPRIRLTMYAYDDTKTNGKGHVIYQAKATQAGELIAEPTWSSNYDLISDLEHVQALGALNAMKTLAPNSLDFKRLGMNAKFQAPDNLPAACTDSEQTEEAVVDNIESTDNQESWGRSSWRWLKWKLDRFENGNYLPDTAVRLGSRKSVSVSQDCIDWIDENIIKNKIIVEVTLQYPVYAGASTTPIDFSSVKIPLLGTKNKSDFTSEESSLGSYISSIVTPDYDKMVVAAHRGYFKDVPENSTAAIDRAIEQNVEIVEIDIRLTKDKKVILAHDLQLGRLTSIPDRIRDSPPEGGWPKMPGPPSGQDKILVSDLTLAEIRPDLYGFYDQEPIYLKKADGTLTNEIVPTLKEVLQQCKGKIIVDIDKIENFFDLVYRDAKETGTLHQIIVKGRFGNPQDLKNKCCSSGDNNIDRDGNTIIDWTKYMFTPIYFSDSSPKDENGDPMTISESLNTFITAPSSDLNCVGVEWVYMTDDDPLIPMIQTIKDQNKHIIQFPQYPENSGGVWNPKKLRFTDVDLRKDHRNDWEWLLDPSRRPSMVITDRLEVLLSLLEIKGLRETRN